MQRSLLAIAAAAALGLSATTTVAQEAGFGGEPNASKNQVPGPSPTKPSDPAAGNPGSAAQIPTAPEVQEDLYGSRGTADASENVLTKPQTSSSN
jgi:uncharacterized membrane protein